MPIAREWFSIARRCVGGVQETRSRAVLRAGKAVGRCVHERRKKKRGERSGSVMLILTMADKMLSDEL